MSDSVVNQASDCKPSTAEEGDCSAKKWALVKYQE
jgi:hypothetical protein